MSLLKSIIAAQGRNGDTELAHVNPEEKALLKSLGGSGTINPVTGLREYSNLDGMNMDIVRDANRERMERWKKESASAKSQESYEKQVAADEMTWSDGSGTEPMERYTGWDEYAEKDWSEDEFFEMSSTEKRIMAQDIFKADTDYASFNKWSQYGPKYDMDAQRKRLTETGTDISNIGESGQSSLLSLSQGQEGQAAKRGFASTGNPMVDRQRENIFKGMSKDITSSYDAYQDSVTAQRKDYQEEWEGALMDYIDAVNA